MITRFAGRKLVVSLLVCLGAVLLCASMAHAQSAGTGAIAGTVTDPQGGAVANATVTVVSLATNQTRTTTTGTAGDYKFTLLPPGNYRVRFSAAGFKTSEVTSVTVDVTETPTVNQTMEVGAVTQTVTVESNVETLQTESSTLGTTVTGNTIASLPLADRNYTEILGLSAGTNVALGDATSLGRGTQDMSVNGNDPGQNNFQMDGVAVNNIANSGSSNDGTIYAGIPIPSPDAISEFKVQTSTYDASYGRNPGANVNVVTKSGTNDFHGSGFEFLRNSVLNSSSYFYNNPDSDRPHQVLDQNQFGGTIGGPIKKDKLFFFLSYQGTRSKNGVSTAGFTSGAGVPPIPAGDRGTCPTGVVALSACDSTAQTFITAVSNALCGPGGFGGPALLGPSCAAPYGGAPNISIQGLHILQLKNADGSYYVPSPATDPSCSATAGTAYSCTFSSPAIYRENQGILNTDYVINSKETLAARYLYTHNPQLDTLNGDLPGTPESVVWGNQDAVLKLTSLLTNNLVNEARISFQRNEGRASNTYPADSTPADLGIAPINVNNPSNLPPTFELINTGVAPFGMFGTLVPFNGPTNQIQAADQISWSHGRHTIRAGFEYEDTRWPLSDNGFTKGFLFFGNLNDVLVGQASPDPGVGAPGSIFECLFCIEGYPQAVTHFYHLHNASAFVQDDFKISPRLTLNLGLRWEFDGMLSDSLGNLTNVWLSALGPNSALPTTLADALADPANSLAGYVVPNNFDKHYGAPPAGVLTASNNIALQKHPPYSNFAPRFGFAWQPLQNSKLVVRGGAGIFYDRVALDRFVHAVEQGNPYAVTYDYSFESPRDLSASLASPYPALPFVPLASDANIGFTARWYDPTTVTGSSLTLPLLDQTVHTPLIQQYNLGFQYEFAHSWVLEMGYVGSRGINLVDIYHNVNTASLATPTNTFSGLCTGVAPDQICNTAANAVGRVPYLGFAASGLTDTQFNGASNYNSLQVTVRHQFSHGLSMQAAYTWSKSLSDLNGGVANGNDASDLGQQWGRTWFNRPNRFIINYSYALPFGNGVQGIEGKLISGWSVSGVTVAQSGDAITFVDSTGGAAYGTSGNTTTAYSRAQLCSGMTNADTLTQGTTRQRLGGYFNADAFCTIPDVPYGTPPSPGDPSLLIPASAGATGFGDSIPGAVLGPGQFNWDISLLKNTKVTERVNMQFRADFYNAFNHSAFADPAGSNLAPTFIDVSSVLPIGTVNGAGSGTFGAITSTIANPRLIQFGLRFTF